MMDKRYVTIKNSISSDGLGIPTISIYFSYCDREDLGLNFCKNCHNKGLQKDNTGYNLTVSEIKKIVNIKLKNTLNLYNNCQIAFLGGEPMAKRNRDFVKVLSLYYKNLGVKSIMYTWRTTKDLDTLYIENIDRIVTGVYDENLKDEEYMLGSTNQKIIDNNKKVLLSQRM